MVSGRQDNKKYARRHFFKHTHTRIENPFRRVLTSKAQHHTTAKKQRKKELVKKIQVYYNIYGGTVTKKAVVYGYRF